MYFITSRLFQKMQNVGDAQKCDQILENIFQTCEKGGPISGEQMRGGWSVLNSKAFGAIPLEITDTTGTGDRMPLIRSITENDFKVSEKFRLRAVALTDSLNPNEHFRRRAHRDLVLWYVALGKMDKADKEKQVLFKLVGVKDEYFVPAIGIVR